MAMAAIDAAVRMPHPLRPSPMAGPAFAGARRLVSRIGGHRCPGRVRGQAQVAHAAAIIPAEREVAAQAMRVGGSEPAAVVARGGDGMAAIALIPRVAHGALLTLDSGGQAVAEIAPSGRMGARPHGRVARLAGAGLVAQVAAVGGAAAGIGAPAVPLQPGPRVRRGPRVRPDLAVTGRAVALRRARLGMTRNAGVHAHAGTGVQRVGGGDVGVARHALAPRRVRGVIEDNLRPLRPGARQARALRPEEPPEHLFVVAIRAYAGARLELGTRRARVALAAGKPFPLDVARVREGADLLPDHAREKEAAARRRARAEGAEPEQKLSRASRHDSQNLTLTPASTRCVVPSSSLCNMYSASSVAAFATAYAARRKKVRTSARSRWS